MGFSKCFIAHRKISNKEKLFFDVVFLQFSEYFVFLKVEMLNSMTNFLCGKICINAITLIKVPLQFNI